MSLSEVLKQITPCDMQKPYIFISYSSNDKDLVWRDVLEFQRLGYNVWLDEKNLDKTKASWKEDALLAIQDIYCMLVVFYVSRSSLISEACYRELSKTTDASSVALHFGPVKFIAVDVDDVGHIGDYTRELHRSIFGNSELGKEAKSKMLLTLHQFMKDFFDSNNEKVRVHPKNETNRKMNYYEEIIASFPDETCDLEQKEAVLRREKQEANLAKAQDEAAAKAYEEATAKLRAESEARMQAEARIQAEAAARAEAEAEAKIWKETVARMQEQADSGRSNPAENTPSDEPAAVTPLTREQIEKAIAQANEPLSSDLDKILSVEKAGEKKIKNAIAAYAKTVPVSDVIGLKDNTLFGSAKEGFLITHEGVYSSFYKKQMIDFSKFRTYQPGRKDYYLDITYTDGATHEFFVPTSSQEVITNLLTAVLEQRKSQQ